MQHLPTLIEAHTLVNGPRDVERGCPLEMMRRIDNIVSSLSACFPATTPGQWAALHNLAQKLARLQGPKPCHDSYVDAVAYFAILMQLLEDAGNATHS